MFIKSYNKEKIEEKTRVLAWTEARCVFRLSVEYCLEYLVNNKMIRDLVSKETAVMRRWGLGTNVWFINRVDN